MSDDKQLEDAQNRLAWRASKEFKKTRRVDRLFQSIAIVAALVIIATPETLPKITPGQIVSYTLAGLFIILCITASLQYMRDQRRQFFDRLLIERSRNLGAQEADLLDEEQLRLGALWRLTEERLRIYHEIATRQAQASFRNAQWAIAGGFVVVVASAGTAFFASTTTITVVVGVLGAAGAALSAYIGRTFLRLQENAAAHLRSYFTQPQEQFRYLAAERLITLMDDGRRKGNTISELVQTMVSSNGQGGN